MSARPRPAGVVLAAGLGTRLRPLTDAVPKALVPVAGTSLLDAALARLAPACGSGRDHLAVNAHHHADQVAAAVGGRAHLSREEPEALGTAGALGALRAWVGGRDVLVTNADAWMPDPAGALAALVDGWDGRRCRLLCVAVEGRGDFPAPGGAGGGGHGDRTAGTAATAGVRYVGTALLPAALVASLEPVPSGLYEVAWRDLAAAGRLDLLVAPQRPDGLPVAVDCGTVADYLRANLAASGGASSIGRGATVLGSVERCVVWDGARVEPGEHLVDAVRAGTPGAPVTAWAAPASARTRAAG